MNIFEKSNYTNKYIKYLHNKFIYEYDISSAGMNILYSLGHLSQDMYNYLLTQNKKDRNIFIGNMQKDSNISEALSDGFKHYRQLFIESNEIQEHQILSIKKDAIYLIMDNLNVTNTKFDTVDFIIKNKYTSFYRLLGSLELYYTSIATNGSEILDVKGISDDKLFLHHDFMLDFLSAVFYEVENGNPTEACHIIKEFNKSYLSRSLDIHYYRRFNSQSDYLINNRFTKYTIPEAPIESISSIDISHNREVLRELYIYIAEIAMQKK